MQVTVVAAITHNVAMTMSLPDGMQPYEISAYLKTLETDISVASENVVNIDSVEGQHMIVTSFEVQS